MCKCSNSNKVFNDVQKISKKVRKTNLNSVLQLISTILLKVTAMQISSQLICGMAWPKVVFVKAHIKILC